MKRCVLLPLLMTLAIATTGALSAGAAPPGVAPPGAKAPYSALGTVLKPGVIAAADTDLAPTGAVPPGSGTAAAGEDIYRAQCAHCHGVRGEGGLHQPLALLPDQRLADRERKPFALDPKRPRVVGNYWPYATTLYDYIRRAMPQLAPGSLSNDEAYAVTAYVLYRNGLIAAQTTVDGRFLQGLRMPARPLFYSQLNAPGRSP